MRFYFYRTPTLLKSILKPCTWTRPTQNKTLYLTFDDGPVPDATPWVLEILKTYEAKATFFVVGENVARYPELFKAVINEGHTIGNHSYHHLKGWTTTEAHYIADVLRCEELIRKNGYQRSGKPLFRPPYGRIKFGQLKRLSNDFEIIMWELLSGDFDKKLNLSSSWKALSQAAGGDLLVFHDSPKYLHNVKFLLPKLLQHFAGLGYTFAPL